MNDNENLKSLYNTLQKEGYTPPAFEQFAKDMEDDGNLRGVYSTLQNEGYTPPDYDTFRSDMGFGKVAKTNPKVKVGSHAQMVVDEYNRAAKAAGAELTMKNEKSDSEARNEANEPNRTDKPNKTNEPDTRRTQFVPEAENVVMATPTADTLKKYPWLKADEAVPFDRNTGEPLHTWVDEQGNPISQRNLDVRRAKEEITGAKEQMRPAAASLQLPGGTTRGVRLDGSISGYVDNMMKQQYGDDYINKQYITKDGRQLSGAEYLNEKEQETYDELNDEIRAARIDMLLSDDEGQKKQLVDNISKKWNGIISEQNLREALNDEVTAREDLVAMAGDEIEKARADERRIRAEMDRRGTELDSQTSPFADQTFNVRGVDSEYRFLTAELNAVQDRIRSWEAVRDSKDIGLLRGLANTAGNIRTWDLGMSDFNTGLALLTSRGEKRQELVNLLGGAQRAASIEDQTTNNIYRWAKIAGESLPFAATFMATGGGLANIGKAAGNRALRIAERRAIDGLAKNVVKNMGVGLGEVASSYLLATTAQGLGTAGDIMRRRTGEIQQGSDGNYELVNGNSWGEAIYKGATAAAIENYTEMLGAHINIGKNVMKFLPKIGMGRVSDWFLKAGKQNWYNTTKEWLSRMGVNGYGGEVLEEEIAIPLNAILVGDNPLLFGNGGLLDKDTQIDILGGMALSIAGMNAGTLAAYGAQRGVYSAMTANDERRLNNADATALEVLGSKWNDIKDDIDNTPNDAMPELMKEYADDGTMSKEEKEAVGGYITSLLRSRGHNLGQNAVMQADEEEQTVLDNNLTPEEQQNVHEDGMIHTALLYPTAENGGEPQEVFITKGNVVMRGDGTIDTEASSNAIYYKGSDGQVHMTSPDKIQSVNEPISVEEYAAAGEMNEPNMPNEPNTTEGFAVGDEVNVNIDDEQAAGEITGMTEDGLLIVSYETPDGTMSSIRISPDELRNMNRPNDEQPPMGGAGAVVEDSYNDDTEDLGDYFDSPEEASAKVKEILESENSTITELPDGKLRVENEEFAVTIKNNGNGEYDVLSFERTGNNGAINNPQNGNIEPQNIPENGNIGAESILEDEYSKFVDTGIVSDEAVSQIADKIINGEQLTPEEESMRRGAAQRVEDLLKTRAATKQEGQQTEAHPTAMERIPKDEKGKPAYERADPETAWDAIMEKTEGDEEMAKNVADAMVKQQETELEKLKKKQPKAPGGDVDAMIAAQKQKKAAIAEAQEKLDKWKMIAGTPNRRKAAATTASEQAAATASKTVEKTSEGTVQPAQEKAAPIQETTASQQENAEKERYSRHTTAKQSAETVGVSQEVEQSGTEQGTEVPAGVQGSVAEGAVSEETPQLEIEPIGVNRFGNIYNWAKGQFQSAASFLNNLKSGYLRGVFYRDDIGNIDMVWGNEKAGLQHIINKHIEEADDFNSVEEAMQVINDTINNGTISQQGTNISLDYNGYRVSIAQSKEGNWVLTAFDKTRSRAEKQRNKRNATIGDQSVSDMENGTLVSPQLASSESKDTQTSANEQTIGEKIAQAEAETDTEPTEAQKEAGNYKKGHVKIDGFDVTIENPKGSVRSGKDADGTPWSVTMNNTYGYIRGTEGVDGDHIDVYLSDNPTEGNVFVIDQVNSDGSFDEHKVMYGFNSAEEARDAYLANYSPGWQGLGTITEVTKDEFKKWVGSSHRKTKPFAEYKIAGAKLTINNEKVNKESTGSAGANENKANGTNEPNTPRPKKGESAVEYTRRLAEVKINNEKVNDEARNEANEPNRPNVPRESSKAERIEKLRKSKPVEITGNEIEPSDDLKQYKKNALEYGKKLRGEYTNKDTGKTVFIGKNGIKEVLQHDYKNVSQLQSIAAIPQIIENSVYIGSMPNTDTKVDAEKFDYYVCGLKIGGENYTVRAVFVTPKNGTVYYDHRLTHIEKGKLLDSLIGITNPGFNQGTSLISAVKDTKLISILQENGREKAKLHDEAHEAFSEIMSKSSHNVEINNGEVSETDNTLYAPIRVDGRRTNLSLYQEEPAHSNEEPIIGVSYYREGLTYQEASDLSEEYNRHVGEDVCSDGNDELAINFNSIDEAVRFEEWLKNRQNDGVRFRKADDEISDFAQKHNLNRADVEAYADYMGRENLNSAARAFYEIRRKVRLDNQGASLGQFTKIFSPIEKELYEKFGNIDDLRQQYVQRTLDERNAMEAARKRAEEAAEAERRRLQEFHDMSDERLDSEYMKAVEANDEGRMRDLVNEAARRKGYGDIQSDYQGVGAWAAPSNPGYESDEERREALQADGTDVNVTDIAEGYSSQPGDYFTNLRAYGNDTPHGKESAKAINDALEEIRKGNNPKIKVYRAVPKSIKEGKMRNGDWVTPSRKYAEMHGDNRLEGDYRIIEQEVPANELWWDGNDLNEWGFDDSKGYAYRNTKNNRKLNDLITRDDEGNIIPLSQRFNARKSDVRYNKDRKRSLSAEEAAIRDAVVGRLRESGLEVITDAEEGQRVLDEANGRGERVRTQAMLDGLTKAADFIAESVKGGKRNQRITIELPTSTIKKIRRVLGRDFDSHNITANSIVHAKKNHGVNGSKITVNSIPLRDEDFSLAPYIMTAPDVVEKGSMDAAGRESIRFKKNLSNGYVVVVEKEQKNSPDDMETITMWAELSSSNVSDARTEARPLNSTSQPANESKKTNARTVIISSDDAAKIRKDAETAIENDGKIREHRVYHGSAADFEAFDHSHMGEGEGAQAYGWGSYVTEVEGIGRMYAERMAAGAHSFGSTKFPFTIEQQSRDYLHWALTDKRIKNFETAREKAVEYCKSALSAAKKDKNDEFVSFYKKCLQRIRTISEYEYNNPQYRHLYTVEIPDDTGENYLDWDKPVTKEQQGKIYKQLRNEKITLVDTTADFWNGKGQEWNSGRELYSLLEFEFSLKNANGISRKAASEFLSRAGFTGIKYPADYQRGGREDGAQNYVIFNEDDLKITDHVRFFRTADGEAYGFTVGGKIYIDPRVATADTPIHEYAHLWASALRQGNQEEWQKVVGLMKGTPVWDEVKRKYPELTTDDEIADEVLATYSGRRGTERLKEEARKATSGKPVTEAARAVTAIGRVREALRKFWQNVADFLHIHYTSAEEVADRVMRDLLEGVNPAEVTSNNEELNGEARNGANEPNEADTPRMDDIRFSKADEDGNPENRSSNKHRELYEKRVNKRIKGVFNRAWFDSMQPVKTLQDAIVKETGQEIKPEENVYLNENRAASVAMRNHEVWERTHMEPVRKEIVKLMHQIMGGNKLTKHLHGGKARKGAYNAVVKYMKSKHGLENNEYRRKMAEQERTEKANGQFNEELARLTEANADKVVLSLGEPSAVLVAAGVEDKPMKLYGSKVIKKMKKHGFTLDQLRDLPRAVADPIAVFNNYQKDGNRAILTELKTKNGNFLVTVDLGKGETDIDFNIISSVFGKGDDNIVDWIERSIATYVNKEKALNYLHHSALRAEALSSPRLISAANIIKDFENPKISTGKKDYSGLLGIYGEDFERKAGEYVADFESQFDTEPFWREWNGATKAILDEEYKAGLISKELYDKIRGMYEYYIPLKGWAENRAEDVYTYYTTGSGDGGGLQRRRGRTSESDDPLVILEQDADRQFTAASRNRMKQTLYNLATGHKTSLLTVRRQWYVNNGTKENPDWERRDAEIPGNATPEEMEKIISDFEKDMRKKQQEGTAMRQEKPMILPYHATKRMEKEHTVRVMVNGKEYVIYVNGDPAAAQAVNGTSTPKDPDNEFVKKWILGPWRWWMRVKASLLTAINLNFIPSNLLRDAQYSIQNMKAKEPFGYVVKYVKNLGECMLKMTSARLFYKDKKGTLDMNDPTERLFKEFLDNGGETGYTVSHTLEQRRRRNMAAVNKLSGIDWFKGWRMLADAIEYVNRSVETIVRFSAYKTSREAGRSIPQSINDAKEASVNFDKHGSGELGNKEWRLAYIFANVQFQSTRRLLENASGHPVRFTLAQMERIATGFVVPMIAKWMLDAWGDDDEKNAYEELPEWMRQSGLTVPLSPILRYVGADDAADKVKRLFLYLPLGPEDKIWYALGEMSYHVFNSDMPTEDMAKKFGLLAADLLPVDFQGYGGNMLVNLAPSVVQDAVALEQNVDYWGRPIYKEDMPYNEHEPGHNKAFIGTPEWFVKRSKEINALTGGDDYTRGAFSPKPEQIEYAVNQTGGGVSRVITQLMSLVERAGEDGNKDVPLLKNIPVLSSIVKQSEPQDGQEGYDREKYHGYMDEYEKTQHDYKAYKKGAKGGDAEAAEKAERLKDSPEGKRMEAINEKIKKIERKDQRVRKIDRKEDPTQEEQEKRDELKAESNELKQQLVEELDSISNAEKK